MMSPDWKRVAAERLRGIKSLRRRLSQDRAVLAEQVLFIIEHELHSRCLASLSDEAWREALSAIRQKVGDL